MSKIQDTWGTAPETTRYNPGTSGTKGYDDDAAKILITKVCGMAASSPLPTPAGHIRPPCAKGTCSIDRLPGAVMMIDNSVFDKDGNILATYRHQGPWGHSHLVETDHPSYSSLLGVKIVTQIA